MIRTRENNDSYNICNSSFKVEEIGPTRTGEFSIIATRSSEGYKYSYEVDLEKKILTLNKTEKIESPFANMSIDFSDRLILNSQEMNDQYIITKETTLLENIPFCFMEAYRKMFHD